VTPLPPNDHLGLRPAGRSRTSVWARTSRRLEIRIALEELYAALSRTMTVAAEPERVADAPDQPPSSTSRSRTRRPAGLDRRVLQLVMSDASGVDLSVDPPVQTLHRTDLHRSEPPPTWSRVVERPATFESVLSWAIGVNSGAGGATAQVLTSADPRGNGRTPRRHPPWWRHPNFHRLDERPERRAAAVRKLAAPRPSSAADCRRAS